MTAEVVDFAHAQRAKQISDAVSDFLSRGWFVAPMHSAAGFECSCPMGKNCGSPGKHPRLGKGYEPSKDAGKVAGWWSHWPLSNIGLFPGPSDLVILDIDPRNGGTESLVEICGTESLPATPTVHTGGGGLHYYFRRPRTAIEMKSGVLGDGVEVKADTGYVITPPGIHYSGKHYAWDAGNDLEVPIAELPAWLYRLIATKQKRREYDIPFDPAGPVAGLIGASFAASNMMGRRLGHDKVAVLCPWRDQHTCGSDYDSSTIVYAPQLGKKWGRFHCSHAHCSSRSMVEVLDALPKAAVESARKVVGIDQDAQPSPPTPKEEPTRPAHAWNAELRYNSQGILTKDPGNAALILANDPQWHKILRFETMSEGIEWMDEPPGISGLSSPKRGKALSEDDYLFIQHWFARKRGVSFGRSDIKAAATAAAKLNSYDALTEYLDALAWDGVERIGTWLSRYLGVKDTAYSRFIGPSWLISAVARAYVPGCQADHILILEGHQGEGKSSALKALSDPWFLPNLNRKMDKDSLVEMLGKWIVCIEELSAVKSQSWENVKSFTTLRTDHFRKPYAADSTARERRCVFCATTNRDDYADDETGSRRLWPAWCTRIDVEAIAKDRDQLWAEAVVAYRRGTEWWPRARDLVAVLEEEQRRRTSDDPWLDVIVALCIAEPAKAWTTRELLSKLGFDLAAKMTQKDVVHVGKIMRRLYYHRGAALPGYGTVWEPPSDERQIKRLRAALDAGRPRVREPQG